MAPKVSDSIYTLRTHLAWLDERRAQDAGELYTFRLFTDELILLLRVCSCLEMFFLQDSAGENELDQTLEYFLERIGVAINDKAQDIYSVIQEIKKGELKYDNNLLSSLVLSYNRFIPILRCLFRKAVETYMYSSQSIHCTWEELWQFIKHVSQDAKNIHMRGSDINLQLHKLEPLIKLVSFVESRGVGRDKMQDLLSQLSYAEAVAIAAAYCSYILLRPEVTDGTSSSFIYSQYSQYSKRLKDLPDLRSTYARVLKASRSSSSSNYNSINPDIVRNFIGSLLKNQPVLLSSDSRFTFSAMKILIRELTFMRDFLKCQRQKACDLDKKMTDIIVEAATEVGILIYSRSWENLKEDWTKNAEFQLSNWIDKVELFKIEVAKKYPETLSTCELFFLDGLQEELKDLKKCNPHSIAFAQGKIDAILDDLLFLRDFLQNMVMKQQNENEELKALWIRVVNISYKTEFAIILLVEGDPHPDCNRTPLVIIKEEIKKIMYEVKEIHMEKRFEIEALNTRKISNHLPSRSSNPIMDEVIVGFEDEAGKVIDLLEAKSAPLDIVSIVGMPGQGKTTLAKKVYNDIKSDFHVCAWCCISQGYQKRKLLLDILNDILNELPGGFNKMNDEDLEELLYKSLKGRRYLIVLDDIWDVNAWYALELSFPDDKNDSRILLTSRINSVAWEIKPDSKSHLLRSLNYDESKELLQRRLFNEKGFPAELRYVEMQIAKSCKGLPLSVVTVAGILKTMEEDSWKDFAEVLDTCLISGTDQCAELLEMSYLHLPKYLKPCLLYFGSFLQDEEISVSRLIWLWMAEGFVQETNVEKSLENVAEDYLIDLINRSLVMVVRQTSRGGIKACSVHDLVHQFCVKKANEENFFQLLKPYQKCFPLSEPRRLYVYSWDYVHCFRYLSSLRFLGTDYVNNSSILCNFKILKVVDLRKARFSYFPAEVEMLDHLRYLALVVGDITSIPSTIVKLWNLETFLLRGLRGEVCLPYTLLNMAKLRHLHVKPGVFFRFAEQKLGKCHEPCNLETFSVLFLSSEQDIVKIIRKIPYLRKLKCTFTGSEGQPFALLDALSRLESLILNIIYHVEYQLKFSFPSTLKKLTLSSFHLPWASISEFALLPNLEVLKLLDEACLGETWDMEEEAKFRKLRFLKLENLDIVRWNAFSDNFNCLQYLVLHKCMKLQEIPSGLGEVPTLKIIEVKRCSRSVATSAEILEKEVEGLKAVIM